MIKLSVLILVAGLAMAAADVRAPSSDKIHHIRQSVTGTDPYVLLSVPKGRAQAVIQDYGVIEEDDDENDGQEMFKSNEAEGDDYKDNDDDGNDDGNDDDNYDDDDDATEIGEKNFHEENGFDDFSNILKLNSKSRNVKDNGMLASHQDAEALTVTNDIIEIEGQTIVDKKTGKTALLLPRSSINSIPNGSLVAHIKNVADDGNEARAHRVTIRRGKGGRRKNKRPNRDNKCYCVVKRGGKKRRPSSSRKNVIIIRPKNGNTRRTHGSNNRRPIYIHNLK